jgi:DNA-binding response OmpR family regulator
MRSARAARRAGSPTTTSPDAGSPMSSTILLARVDDDHAPLVCLLERAGLAVEVVDLMRDDLGPLTGRARLVIASMNLASERAPDVLDAVATGPQPPAVMVLTPDVPLAAKLHAYDAGADDVVITPCSLHEVVARARALLRRAAAPGPAGLPHLVSADGERTAPSAGPAAAAAAVATAVHDGAPHARPGTRIALGAAVLDVAARAVVRDGRAHNVRPKEYALLDALLRRPGEVVSREELLADVWGYATGVTTRTVDTHVVRLRRLIERVPSRPEVLLTVAKLGYRLVLPAARDAAERAS